MPRPLIYQPDEWGIVEVTFRCQQGRYLLSPGKESNNRLLGVLGRAQALYGRDVKLIFVGGTSNHHSVKKLVHFGVCGTRAWGVARSRRWVSLPCPG